MPRLQNSYREDITPGSCLSGVSRSDGFRYTKAKSLAAKYGDLTAVLDEFTLIRFQPFKELLELYARVVDERFLSKPIIPLKQTIPEQATRISYSCSTVCLNLSCVFGYNVYPA